MQVPGTLPEVGPGPVRPQGLSAVHQRRLPDRGRPEALDKRPARTRRLPPGARPGPPHGEAGSSMLLLRRPHQPRPQGEPLGQAVPQGQVGRGRGVRQEGRPEPSEEEGGPEDGVVQGERGLLRHRGGDHPGHRQPGGGGDGGGAGYGGRGQGPGGAAQRARGGPERTGAGTRERWLGKRQGRPGGGGLTEVRGQTPVGEQN
uniref:Uncharacterized protein n=1 Tax=Gasterosteus aculeatus TaxID=69293 RepID=G3PYT4_GASAC